MGGTAFTNPQFAEVIGPVAKALAQVVEGRDPAQVIKTCNTRGAELQELLAVAFDQLLAPKDPAAASEPKPSLFVAVKQTTLGSTSVTTFGLRQNMMFAQMFRALLKLPETATIEEIANRLKQGGHTLASQKIDLMIEKQEKFVKKQEGGEDFGFRTDGFANFFPVENADGSVSVAYAGRGGRQWLRDVYSLGHGRVWDRGHRLVVSNSDASNL